MEKICDKRVMDVAEDLSCREIVELVTEYLEGTMPVRDREAFELHLVLCDGCANYLDQVREMVGLTGRLREGSLSPETLEDLCRSFRDWRGK